MVVFIENLLYNCPIMSSENKGEWLVNEAVNQVFDETFGTSLKGRRTLAAFALSEHVGIMRGLLAERDAAHKDVPSATSQDGVAIFSPQPAPDQQEVFSDIESATMALNAALDGAQSRFGLSAHQARKALRLAEKTFWLFDGPDPRAK